MKPRVAIITRTKNRPLLLPRALESVLGQTETAWEHIIVNDGGDREALEAQLEAFTERYDGRLQVVHHETSQGMQGAGNAGIAASSAPFLTIHDDDDTWHPEFLEAALAFLEEKGPDSPYQGVISYTEEVREKIDANGTITEESRKPYIPLPEISLFRLGYENPFPPIAFCYRRTAYDAIGPYNERFTVAGDYDFNFRFLRRFEIGVITRPLAYYHVRSRTDAKGTANSIAAGASEHKLRYNELKNHYLRDASSEVDPAQRLAFNVAKYLVELEWVAHEIHRDAERVRVVEDRVEHGLSQSAKAYEGLFERLSEVRGRLEDVYSDPRALEMLDGLIRDLSFANEQLGKLDEMVRDVAYTNTRLELLDGLMRDLAFANEQLGQLEELRASHSQLRQFLDQFRGEAQAAREQTQDQFEHLRGEAQAADASSQERIEQFRRETRALSEHSRAHLDQVRDSLLSQLGELTKTERTSLLEALLPHLTGNREALDVLGQAVEARAVDILQEIQQHHTYMHSALKEKTLLQLGPFRISWKKKRRRPSSPPSDDSPQDS
jgi:glycosyltransferase involved in cell wall biosynthesis